MLFPHLPQVLHSINGPKLCPRMCLMINIENPVLCDVGVNLRGRQIAVSQQFLDAAEVRATVQ